MTQTPSTVPQIGGKVTFTCAATSTPAGAISPFYEFRYRINNAATYTKIGGTGSTAELTIAACGTYEIQCHACYMKAATAPGVSGDAKICDPVWSGVAVQ